MPKLDLLPRVIPRIQGDEEAQLFCEKQIYRAFEHFSITPDLLFAFPLFKSYELKEDKSHFRWFLLTQHRAHANDFFFEIASRGFIPGRRIPLTYCFSVDFHLPDIDPTLYSLFEVHFTLDGDEAERAALHLAIIEEEIKMGVISSYHAHKLLEIAPLSSDEKGMLIQQRLSHLLQKNSRLFDEDLLTHMHRFLASSSEMFKMERTYEHLSRIVAILYLFERKLEQAEGGKRPLLLKLKRTYLELPLGAKEVIGIFVGMHFLKQNETFEKGHFFKAFEIHFPHLKLVSDSVFSLEEKQRSLFYLEVEKRDGSPFTTREVTQLKERLPEDLKGRVQQLVRPLFMPRNEEEVMRNILTLSRQLRYVRDLPQVYIFFEGQTERGLAFTILLLRLQKQHSLPIDKLFNQKSEMKFYIEKIKIVGSLRKRYPKEASVLRAYLPVDPFLRDDHSIDLYRARQDVLKKLELLVGEVRDYNGGIISQQNKNFSALKELIGTLSPHQELLLQNFFHSLFPVECRSTIAPSLLKKLFMTLLKQLEEKKELLIVEEKEQILVLLMFENLSSKEKISHVLQQFQIATRELITLDLLVQEVHFLGYIFFSSEPQQRTHFLEIIGCAHP